MNQGFTEELVLEDEEQFESEESTQGTENTTWDIVQEAETVLQNTNQENEQVSNEVIEHAGGAIIETADSISYFGIELPKAKENDSPLVPKRKNYVDFIPDDFSLNLQKNIAISLAQGDPLLVEGGTSIGKTFAIKKMAAELGWEVHYINLNGATDVENLMGRYVPNANKKSPEDPEYIFADGKVTSGLRQEEGKIKIIVLDELNAASPDVLIRLHEVLDALNSGEDVVLSESTGEGIPVNKQTTKIVGLMNPPGKGYFGREPLDPAQLRRWVYYKAPSELPVDAFSVSVDELFRVSSIDESNGVLRNQEFEEETLVPEGQLGSKSRRLSPEQLKDIAGLPEILSKYKEFHITAKELVKNRKVAADQPQPFTFDDRVEPKRVRDFILRYFNGDITETFQNALRYYYSNKLESDIDRETLEEAILLVEAPAYQRKSNRRGLEDMESAYSSTESKESREFLELEIIKREKEEWRKVLGVDIEVDPLPDSVTPELVNSLKHLGMELRYIPKIDFIDTFDMYNGYIRPDMLARKYPNWKGLEGLTEGQRKDPKIYRNLPEDYWKDYGAGTKSNGYWLAVEVLPKPDRGQEYVETELSKTLEVKTRFLTYKYELDNILTRKRYDLLKQLFGRQSYRYETDFRLLSPLEWNLLGNREGWGGTDTYEMISLKSQDMVIGNSDLDGAGGLYDRDRDDLVKKKKAGFRLALFFDREQARPRI